MNRIVRAALMAVLPVIAGWVSVTWLRRPAGRRPRAVCSGRPGIAVLPLSEEPAAVSAETDRPFAAAEPSTAMSTVDAAVTEPAVAEPAVAEPAVTEPAVTEPAVTEPTAGAPSAEGAPVVPGPYPGSARSLPDGSAPGAEYTIKAKNSSKLFHSDASPYYRRTRADLWFRAEEDALAAGLRAWKRS